MVLGRLLRGPGSLERRMDCSVYSLLFAKATMTPTKTLVLAV